MKSLSVKPFYIAGVKHANSHTLPVAPVSSYVTEIRHNPENKFDPFALEVYFNNVLVGHIPRTDQAPWFYYTLMNVIVELKVNSFDRNVPPFEQIQVEYVCSDMYIALVAKVSKPKV